MKAEHMFYLDALCACYSDVASAFPAHKIEHHRDRETILRRFELEGVGFLTKALPSLAKAIDTALATGTTLQAPCFGKKRGSKLPRFCGWLIGRVFDQYGMEKADADPIALKYLRQLLYLFYKLELPYNSTQTNRIYETFKKSDQELLQPWQLPEPQHRYAVKFARDLVSRLLAGLCPRDILPRHGPGSVATGERPTGKPHLGDYYHKALHEYYHYDEYLCFSPMQLVDSLSKGRPRLVGRDGKDLKSVEIATAKVVTVPKDSRGPRLISMEPLVTQWVQQGQLDALVKRVESHWLTRGHVNFSKQEVNRVLAYLASCLDGSAESGLNRSGDGSSITLPMHVAGVAPTKVGVAPSTAGCRDVVVRYNRGVNREPTVNRRVRELREYAIKSALESDDLFHFQWKGPSQTGCRQGSSGGGPGEAESDLGPFDLVTLDMKDASDRVSLQLVQTLFPSNWVEALEATRSPQTRLPTGEIVLLNKFAPMGSAVCFPVEALCFWALALAGIYLRNPELTLTQLKERVWVYGDDIITYRKDYPAVMQMLERVGLKFNLSKCCTHGSFRESCGLDAYRGVVVTPTRVKARWCHRLGVQALSSYVSYSNELYNRGFYELAEFLEVRISMQHRKIPFTREYHGGIQFVRPYSDTIKINRERGIRMRVHPKLQVLSAKGPKLRAVNESGPRHEWSTVLYTMAQKGMLGSDSTKGLTLVRKAGIELLEAGLYPSPHRVTSVWGWTAVT